MPLSPDLQNLLVCPACKGDLVYDGAQETLTCERCRLRYKVVGEIPDMLVEHAEKI